jgi:NAD(P)-dependent dehydrogenase (short-subunit alcohol dehydrogenase family)
MKVLIFGKSDIGEGIKQLYPDTVNVPKEECDVRDASQVRNTLKKYQPDVIVNCAGISHVQVVKDSNIDHWKEEIDVNLVGSFIVARESVALNLFRPMIFIASVAGMYGKPEHSGYSASKSGVISFVQSLGLEGYNAYSISPGRVDTKMRENDYPGEDKRTRLSTLQVAEVVKECIDGKYEPGDNIIIRKKGFTKLKRVDKGHPWKKYLNVQPLGAPKTI